MASSDPVIPPISKPPKLLDQVRRCIRDNALQLTDGRSPCLLDPMLYPPPWPQMECMTLRMKDVDFGRRESIIREGKGNKDRIMMLPIALVAPPHGQIAPARVLYDEDCVADRPGVMLPDALDRNYPRGQQRTEDWFWIFPSDHESTDPRSGTVRRHHRYE